jgi:MFS family permease
MSDSGLRAPLRRPAFRRLVLSYGVNEMGDWLGVIALSILVFDGTDSALATALLFLCTGVLPAMATPVLVARMERPPPRLALPVLYALEAVAFGALALLAGHFSLVLIAIVATLDGALALTARTLTRAVSATILEPEGELRAGNAILNGVLSGGAALGPLVAGAVVAAFNVQTALLLDAVSFLAIGWILYLGGKSLPHAEPEPGGLRDQVRAGIGYIRNNVRLRRLLAAQAAAIVFFYSVLPIEVIYAKETLDAGDTGYGLLLAGWGTGMVFGGIFFAAVRRAPMPLLLFFSTLAIGAGYLGMAVAPNLPIACAAAFIGGLGNGAQWAAVMIAVQELTVQKMQARVIGTLESISSAMPAVGFVAGGVIASVYSPRATFLVAGLGVFAIVAIATPLLGTDWPDDSVRRRDAVDGDEEVVVELYAAFAAGRGRDLAPSREE